MTEVKDDSVHLCVTSPPYINAIDYNRQNPDNIGNYDGMEYYEMIYDVYREVYRVLQPGRRFCLNIQDIPAKDEVGYVEPVGFKNMLLCQKVGFTLSAIVIWTKGRCRAGGTPLGTMPYPPSPNILGNFEYIWVLRKPGIPDYSHVTGEMRERSKMTTEDIGNYIYSTWDIRPDTDRVEHPAKFPEELPYRCIRLFSFAGETVLEPFAGSGTTLKVARDLRRNAIGYELESKYISVIKSKLAWGLQFLGDEEQYEYTIVGEEKKKQVTLQELV
jgi:DNA modification methylase